MLLERARCCLVWSPAPAAAPGGRARVPPAAPAHPDLPGHAPTAAGVPSVLFVNPAPRPRGPDFQITARNAALVAACARKLEGIPLALEPGRRLGPDALPRPDAQRLGRRFELLVSRRRDLSPRHRTLRAALEWSHEPAGAPGASLLSPACPCSGGGWTLEAAETVCQEPEALDYLTELRDHSLLLAQEQDEVIRFRMLETLREFAREQPRTRRFYALSARHAHFFLRRWSRPSRTSWGPSRRRGSTAWRRSTTTCAPRSGGFRKPGAGPERGFPPGGGAPAVLGVRGHLEEDARVLAAMLARAQTSRAAGGPRKGVPGPPEGQSDDRRRQHGLLSGARHGPRARCMSRASRCCGNKATAAKRRGRAQQPGERGQSARRLRRGARALHEESLILRRKGQDRRGIASRSTAWGTWSKSRVTTPRRAPYTRRVWRSSAKWGDTTGIATTLDNLGIVARFQGDAACARPPLHEESLALLRGAWGDKQGTAISSSTWACCQGARRPRGGTRSLRGKSGDTAGQGRDEGFAWSLRGFAGLAAAQGRAERAARMFGAAEALYQAIGRPVPLRPGRLRATVAAVRAALGEATSPVPGRGAGPAARRSRGIRPGRAGTALPSRTVTA